MSNYVFSFYGEPKFDNREEGASYQAKWQTWVGNLGAALVAPVIPFGISKTVSSNGVTDEIVSPRLTGFSIVKAASIEDAIEMAQKCPHLDHGKIDVAQAMEM